jgi:hypothetical protein
VPVLSLYRARIGGGYGQILEIAVAAVMLVRGCMIRAEAYETGGLPISVAPDADDSRKGRGRQGDERKRLAGASLLSG